MPILSEETKEKWIYEEPYAKDSSQLYPDAMEELLKPYPSTNIETMPKFTNITGGFRPFEYSILCGATGVGKTTLLANLSSSLSRQGVPHFVASVETGPTDFIKRCLSVAVNRDINRGDPISIEEAKRIHINHSQYYTTNPTLHLSLYDNRCEMRKLLNDIAWHVENKGIKVAMIDNINFFMEITSAQNQIIEMDRVIHEGIIFCKQVPVHIIMVMHPKKTDGGRVESEFDIKGSSTAVQEAHNVFLFNRPSPEMIEEGIATKYDRELKIAKMRRRGMSVGAKMILTTGNGTKYDEGKVYEGY